MSALKTLLERIDTNLFLWMQRTFFRKSLITLFQMVSKTGDDWLYPIVVAMILLRKFDVNDSNVTLMFLISSLFAFGLQIPFYMLLKRNFIVLPFCRASLSGLSRVVLSVHYPGDMLAGISPDCLSSFLVNQVWLTLG